MVFPLMVCPAVVDATQIPIHPVRAVDAEVQFRIVLFEVVFTPPSVRIPIIRPKPLFRF